MTDSQRVSIPMKDVNDVVELTIQKTATPQASFALLIMAIIRVDECAAEIFQNEKSTKEQLIEMFTTAVNTMVLEDKKEKGMRLQ
jgi:hypothetical protein